MWPGTADAVREWIGGLHQQWRQTVERLEDEDLLSNRLTRWPFQDRPFGDVIAWVNIELTKNAAGTWLRQIPLWLAGSREPGAGSREQGAESRSRTGSGRRANPMCYFGLEPSHRR